MVGERGGGGGAAGYETVARGGGQFDGLKREVGGRLFEKEMTKRGHGWNGLDSVVDVDVI